MIVAHTHYNSSKEILLDNVPVKPANILPPPILESLEDPAQCAVREVRAGNLQVIGKTLRYCVVFVIAYMEEELLVD